MRPPQTLLATPTEIFLLSRSGFQSAYPQIGIGIIKSGRTKQGYDMHLLFDQASTDCWVTPHFAKTMGCKRLPDWRGDLTNINWREHISRPAVEFGVYNYETQQVVCLQAIISAGEKSRKPKILAERFDRLSAIN